MQTDELIDKLEELGKFDKGELEHTEEAEDLIDDLIFNDDLPTLAQWIQNKTGVSIPIADLADMTVAEIMAKV
jgi:hypothetical protein